MFYGHCKMNSLWHNFCMGSYWYSWSKILLCDKPCQWTGGVGLFYVYLEYSIIYRKKLQHGQVRFPSEDLGGSFSLRIKNFLFALLLVTSSALSGRHPLCLIQWWWSSSIVSYWLLALLNCMRGTEEDHFRRHQMVFPKMPLITFPFLLLVLRAICEKIDSWVEEDGPND